MAVPEAEIERASRLINMKDEDGLVSLIQIKRISQAQPNTEKCDTNPSLGAEKRKTMILKGTKNRISASNNY